MWRFSVADSFIEAFATLDQRVQESVKLKLEYISETPYPLYYAKKLQSCRDMYRFRAEDFRIIFRLTKNEIIFLTVRHRKDVYRDL